jgi:kynurenine 3-monooxygenase
MKEVTILGAGLVGSLLACLLKQKGLNVKVYEKRSDIRSLKNTEDRSINLIVTSRGLKALDRAGLFKKSIELTVPILGRSIHSKTGDQVFQPYGRPSEGNFSISRSKLNSFLISEAEKIGVEFFFSDPISSIDFSARTFRTAKGAEGKYQLLLGTDGAGSVVRTQLEKEFPAQFRSTTEFLEADYKELTLPARSDGSYPLDPNSLHIWPRGTHMMMALANPDGSFTVTAYLPKSGAPISFEKIRSASDVESLFKSEFMDAMDLMPDHQMEFLENPQGRLGTVRCQKWAYGDSVLLIGDAAHAIVPFFGQGMNLGFEDCVLLMDLFEKNEGRWEKIFKDFESQQIPNAMAIADMALENWTEMKEKVGDQKFLLRKKVEAEIEAKFPDLYKPRYGIITYTQVPYALAKEAGRIQNEILNQICDSISDIQEVNWDLAKNLIVSQFRPFVLKHNLNLVTEPLIKSGLEILGK